MFSLYPEAKRMRHGHEELLEEWKETDNGWIWVDFENEVPGREAELFSERFGLGSLAVSDAQRARHPPKLEFFDDYFLLLLNGLDAKTVDIEFGTIQLALFVGKRFLVTRRKESSVSIDTAWADAKEGRLNLARGPIHIAYRISGLSESLKANRA